MMKIEYLNPVSAPHWNAEIGTFPEANIFHTDAWAKTLMEAYQYEPQYAVWYEGGSPQVVAPFMEVKSVLTGKRGVSLPFTDLCPILTKGPIPTSEVIKDLYDHGRARKWKTLETRGLIKAPENNEKVPTFYIHELDLLPGEELLFAQIRSSTRRNIRKSEKQGVHVVTDNSTYGLAEFCRLNMITRRDHGLPPQPKRFFDSLFRNVIEPGFGRILLAIYNGQCIASAVFLQFNGHAIYKYGASDKKYQALRANNLLMWEAIRIFSNEGARTFHFGRTEPENAGLLQFKRGWGAVEGPLVYGKYNFKSEKWVINSASASGLHTKLFSRMPLFALRFVGKILYRHMG